MKGKTILIRDLQEEINTELQKFVGKKYKDAEYIGWWRSAAEDILNNHQIREIKTKIWDIVADVDEHGVYLGLDSIATCRVNCDRDKRIKYGPGRGKIICMSVEFREDILNMTLDEARRYLLNEKRNECVERLKNICVAAQKEIDDAEKAISDLISAEF